MARRFLAVLAATLLALSLLGCSSDDDKSAEVDTDAESTSTTAADPTDDDDETLTEAAKLVESVEDAGFEDMLATAGIDVDADELEACFVEALLDDPTLLELDFDTLEPTDPEGAVLFDLLFGCLPEGSAVELMVAGIEESGAPPEAVECVRGALEALPEDEVIAFLLDAAADDTEALEAVLGDCV